MFGDLLESQPLLRTFPQDAADEVARELADVRGKLDGGVEDTVVGLLVSVRFKGRLTYQELVAEDS